MYTKEEVVKMMTAQIYRDRQISFLTAALRWASGAGLPPEIVQEGQNLLQMITAPQQPQPQQPQPQQPVQPPGEKQEE